MSGIGLAGVLVAIRGTSGQWIALAVVLAVTAVVVFWMVTLARRNRRR